MNALKFVVIIKLFSVTLCSAQNYVLTIAGNGTAGNVNGNIQSARFNEPFGMCMDANQNLFIADAGNHSIRKINLNTGDVSTYAGSGTAGFADGPALFARFNAPSDLCVDDSGNVYVSDFQNQRIRKISTTGNVSTIAGSTAGYVDDTSSSAKFNYPRGICIDKNHNLYIGDSWNHRIRMIDVNGAVTTYAGGGINTGVSSTGDYLDGQDTASRFYTPTGLSIDNTGNIFVADAYNHRIRKIDTLRNVTTICGSGSTGTGSGGYLDGDFSVALLNTPTEVFTDTVSNELYISDTFNNRIRKVDLSSFYVSTFAGNGFAAYVDNIDTAASFNFPRGIVVSNDAIKKIYLSDYNNHSIRKISSENTVIDEIYKPDNLVIFPNPVTDYFIIKYKYEKEIKKITLTDRKGASVRVYENLKQTTDTRINLNNLPEGIYSIKVVFDDNSVMSCKIVKLR